MTSIERTTTILNQLGGSRFTAMTGSKNFVALENGVRMDLAKNISGANRLEITVNGLDLYEIRFYKALNVSMDYLCGITNLEAPKESLSAEVVVLMRCYDRADIRDKKTIWTVLERYMTEAEKESGLVLNLIDF